MTRATIASKLQAIGLDYTTHARIMGLIDIAVEQAYYIGVNAADEIGKRHSEEKKKSLHNTAFTRMYQGKKAAFIHSQNS